MHNLTTLNRQGNDIGDSYRSAIFCTHETQVHTATEFVKRVNERGDWGAPVVTQVEMLTTFWPAEPEHQYYLQRYPNGYTCHFVRDIPTFL